MLNLNFCLASISRIVPSPPFRFPLPVRYCNLLVLLHGSSHINSELSTEQISDLSNTYKSVCNPVPFSCSSDSFHSIRSPCTAFFRSALFSYTALCATVNVLPLRKWRSSCVPRTSNLFHRFGESKYEVHEFSEVLQ